MVQLGELTEQEFNHVVVNFRSVHEWASQPRTRREPFFAELPEGVYDVLLADPPWEYEFSMSSRGARVHWLVRTRLWARSTPSSRTLRER